jgi:uncharacterized membrane protein YdjX (TVP38/TMEM64 family)
LLARNALTHDPYEQASAINGESIVLRQDENRKAKAPQANLQSASSSLLRRYAPLGIVLALLGIAWVTGLLDYFSLSSLIMHRDALREFVGGNLFAGLVGYVVIYAMLVAISFPGASLLTVAAGFVFGGILGGGATVIGATLGAATIFQIARTSLGKTMQERTGKFVARLRNGFQENAFNYLLMLRLTPVFPFWVINIVPALLGMKLLPYAAATFLGIIPGTFAYAYIGAGLDSVIAAQEAANPGCAAAGTCEIDPGSLVTTDVIVAMVALGLISLLPVVIKKIRGRPLSQ